MLYDRAIKELKQLENKINELNENINELPEGKLICAANGEGRGMKWYLSDGHRSVYLPKKERRFAEQLALKRYLMLQLENLQKEKKAIERYLKYHNSNPNQKEQEFLTNTGFRELLISQLNPISEQLNTWTREPYIKNERYVEGLIYTTPSGNKVRSKSEVLIDMYLYKSRIPFRYECLLQLGEIALYPDFTIRHPETGEIFYWEHLGRMDDLRYASQAYSKLQLYAANGIIPNINLIITCETKEHPISTEMIEKIIEFYFLS